MNRLFREPLLHFVVLGAALFLLNGFLGDGEVEAGTKDIVVTQGRIDSLVAVFAKTSQRSPTKDELRGMVREFVLEEALYREGKAMGVDQDDIIIRRRVRQKLDFVAEDIVGQAEPTEAELENWLAAHADAYTLPARFRFRQIYLNPERHDDTLQSDAKQALQKLRSLDTKADPRQYGDVSLLEHAFKDVAADVVARTFGESFVEALAEVPAGEWSGPLESAFGLHLVIVDQRRESSRPALHEVRDAVERDCAHAKQQAAIKSYHEAVLSRYHVAIEWPEGVGPEVEKEKK